MTVQTPTTLKTFFQTGDKPSQSNFSDLIDSSINQVVTSAQLITSDVSALGNFDFRKNVTVSAAVVIGNPTGGNKGIGTLNATGIYVNGTLITTTSAGDSGTVNTGIANQIAFYPSSTNSVSGTNTLPNGTLAVTGSAGTGGTSIATQGYVDRGASGASMVLISNQVASNVASINFTNIPGNYDHYVVRITGALPVTNSVVLAMRYSENNGSSYISANYAWAANKCGSNATAIGTGSASDSSIGLTTGAGVVNNLSGVFGEITLMGLGSSTLQKACLMHTWFSDGAYETCTGIGTYTGDTNVVNAIQFLFATGNIASGSFALYGVRNS